MRTETTRTIPQAAKIIGVHAKTLTNWVKTGKVKSEQASPNATHMIPQSEIDRLRKERDMTPASTPISDPKISAYVDVDALLEKIKADPAYSPTRNGYIPTVRFTPDERDQMLVRKLAVSLFPREAGVMIDGTKVAAIGD